VVDAYEPRMEFIDDEISPIIGYLLVSLAVIALAIGSLCFLGEYANIETGIQNLDYLS